MHPSTRLLFRCLQSFFFSSRRRHTRWPRDWSSDVCSSDLFRQAAPGTSGQFSSASEQVMIAANSLFGLTESSNVFEKQIIGFALSLNRTSTPGLSPPGLVTPKPARSIAATALGLNAVASVPPE